MNMSNRFCHFGGWSDPPSSREQAARRGGERDAEGGQDERGAGAEPAGTERAAKAGGELAGTAGPAGAERWIGRPARAADFDAWDELFAGYCDFYERPSTPEHRRRVWSWIEAGTIRCLVAVPMAIGDGGPGEDKGGDEGNRGDRGDGGKEDDEGASAAESPGSAPRRDDDPARPDPPSARADRRPMGLAHVRPMPSPLRGTTTGFLDDLFIAPAARGTGAFECLVAAIRDLAVAEGWPQVRWITAADNARARAAYDRVATKTDWVTYQLDP
ncbi:MAG TPA: GNAT family N-acetyltransferase [Solirubrobacterales bacterium]|nr:GNAT family N-acetyltransferase [Solirubrobacterales bacterium]